jgi:hypothetical protein
MKASARIKAAQRDNERWVLGVIRREGSYSPCIPRQAIYNALERLVAFGVVRWCERKFAYVLGKVNYREVRGEIASFRF